MLNLTSTDTLTLIRIGNPTEKKRQILTLVVNAEQVTKTVWGHKTTITKGQRIFMSMKTDEGEFTGEINSSLNYDDSFMEINEHKDENGEPKYWLVFK